MASTGRVEKSRAKKKPLKKWDLQDTVTIRAGAAALARDLITHRELACYYSPVFKAAFNSQFVEGETQTYTLDDVGPAVARLLIHWFYHQELDLEFSIATKGRADMQLCELWVRMPRSFHPSVRRVLGRCLQATEERKFHETSSLVIRSCNPRKSPKELALLTSPSPKILADKLMIPSLKNLVIGELERLRKRFHTISTHCLNYVYENTESESPLRMLFLHWCAFNMVESRFKEKPEHFPKEMLLDLAVMQSRALPKKTGELKSERRDMMMFKVEEME
ncbi:hypothetical protein LOCC1_G005516 [Lachnellula occidentalis]|uniref:BTB domain-containing protein n=1 Tax=Lachnellula occidentalis TaxID=215460 RepID=A0A8H8U6E5_9HELO|nr:hypothetical protein LOCC1_G005516 [Lachnellula occidentalis]